MPPSSKKAPSTKISAVSAKAKTAKLVRAVVGTVASVGHH
jgi:hypothetical protein